MGRTGDGERRAHRPGREPVAQQRDGGAVPDRAYRYRIEASTDRTTWQRVIDRSGNTAGGTQLDDFATGPITARYVRLTVLAVYGVDTTWVGIDEFAVYDGYHLPNT